MTGIKMGRLSRCVVVAAVAESLGLVSAMPASAASSKQKVKCRGTADFCGATVSVAGGASNRQVTVMLSGTNLKLVAVRVIPAKSKGAYSITRASYRLGGSVYRFTLSAVKANPKGARIVLLFAAGAAGSK